MNIDYVIGVYLRISSEDVKASDGDSNSIISQRETIMNYIANHKELKNASLKEYIDDGISGTNFDREAVSELIEDARHGLINCIIVKDFSRFGRNYIESGTYMDKIFPFLGIRFISVNDHHDSKNVSTTGSIDVAFKNMIHDFYSKDLSKKIISAKRANAEKGMHTTAYAPYGFIKGQDKKLVLDSESDYIVRRIFSMRLNGQTLTEIARTLNNEGIPSPLMLRKKRNDKFPCNKSNEITYWRGARIQAILKDRRYIGDAVYGKYKRMEVGSKKDVKVPESQWIVVKDAHEGIISRKDFEKVQSMFRHYSKKDRKKNTELFTSKIKCAGCNHTLVTKVYDNKAGKVVRYVCNTKNSVNAYNCVEKQIDEVVISKVILTMLQKFSQLVDDINQVNYGKRDSIREFEVDIKGYKNTLLILKNKKFDNYKAYKADNISLEVFKKKKDDYEKREEIISNQLEDLNHKVGLLQSNVEQSEDTLKEFNRLSPFDKLNREMVDVFIDHIEIDYRGRLGVVWNFEDIF
ncbi:MAG: recombinase family protein [Vallitalea sp.]|jgi:DNA invertase Pin-like site-specific DNA recombinase|nr:recombinase family protein [Vallitalea sp.]